MAFLRDIRQRAEANLHVRAYLDSDKAAIEAERTKGERILSALAGSADSIGRAETVDDSIIFHMPSLADRDTALVRSISLYARPSLQTLEAGTIHMFVTQRKRESTETSEHIVWGAPVWLGVATLSTPNKLAAADHILSYNFDRQFTLSSTSRCRIVVYCGPQGLQAVKKAGVEFVDVNVGCILTTDVQ